MHWASKRRSPFSMSKKKRCRRARGGSVYRYNYNFCYKDYNFCFLFGEFKKLFLFLPSLRIVGNAEVRPMNVKQGYSSTLGAA